MAELTSVFGINSGFDTAKVVESLIALQSRPIDINLAKRDAEVEKLETFQDLKARLGSFKTVLNTLNKESRFISTQGSFSGTGTTTTDIVDITTTSTATSGTFTLSVSQLAREAKLTSEGFASLEATIPSGTLELIVGGNTTLIDINSTNNTVDGLRLAINNSGAEVSANFVNDGSANPIRLVISGNQTGAENTVSARIFTNGLGVGEQTQLSFTETQTPLDALMTLDGISISKSSNTVTDIINGAILKLKGTGDGNIQLSTDLGAISDKVTDFVTEYNDLTEYIQELLSFNPETLESGAFLGNFAIQNLQNILRGTVSGEVSGTQGPFSFLSQVGITTQSDGKIVLENSKLNDALQSDLGNVADLFSSRATVDNVNTTFIGFTETTQAGTFEIRVQGGVPQIRRQGETAFVDATGSGNFFAGPEGHSSEGLNFRLANLTDGNYGTINLTIGVAESLNRQISFLTDSSQNGPVTSEINTITETIDNLDDTLLQLDARIAEFEKNIKERFANLEIILGRLNTQSQSFSSSIASIQNLGKK
ncbi:MAG: flagellar filament capping protein FliD [Candidatus Nitronauta litoralis]|uniref:Flagellar hook-associated protein 2 n=1 Tax=Candidatus Nitronauta litoralis TaxID=2705533 RepID=A0A7T0BY24_9BACT|nr:MAG: flagellar filament capping protein FliD [Candidatus Nitronauta litoralis]